MSKKSWVCKSCGWRVTSNDELEHGIGFVCGLGVATREKLPTVNGFYGMTIVRSPEEAVVNNTPDPIRDDLDGIIASIAGDVYDYATDADSDRDEAVYSAIQSHKKALNAYILGEVMELINSCYDKDYGIDSVALRNKAIKKWGKL